VQICHAVKQACARLMLSGQACICQGVLAAVEVHQLEASGMASQHVLYRGYGGFRMAGDASQGQSRRRIACLRLARGYKIHLPPQFLQGT
jgi:hypothetical protein